MTATWALTVATTRSETARLFSSILEKDNARMRMVDLGRGASYGISRVIYVLCPIHCFTWSLQRRTLYRGTSHRLAFVLSVPEGGVCLCPYCLCVSLSTRRVIVIDALMHGRPCILLLVRVQQESLFFDKASLQRGYALDEGPRFCNRERKEKNTPKETHPPRGLFSF